MMTPEMVDQMNLDKSLAFYKDRFSDASDFTFVFVGSFDVADDEAARRAVSGRPAGDPPEGDVEGRRHQDSRPASIEKRVDKGIEPKSRADIVFSGPFQYNQEQRVGDPRDGAGARDPAARVAARGSRRHLQRVGVGRATRRFPARSTRSRSASGAAPIAPRSS